MEFFSTVFKEREYQELISRGYLKIKFELPASKLKDIDMAWREGSEIEFDYKNQKIKTIIISVDISEDSTLDTCKVFLGITKSD
jgi:hypothetical protein